jgi:hypothetical protein
MGRLGFGLAGVVLSLGVGCSDGTATPRLAASEGTADAVSSALTDTFEQRAQEVIGQIAVRTPENTSCQERVRIAFAKLAHAALYETGAAKTTSIAAGNELIENLELSLMPDNDSLTEASLPCFFVLPLLVRTYAWPVTHDVLSENARLKLRQLLRRFVQNRSKIVFRFPPDETWYLFSSENIDAIMRSTLLLATNALRGPGPYGDSDLLDDGRSLATHQAAWRQYWKEYFRQRAREGVNTEYASPGYMKYSLMAYYNVRDLGGSQDLRAQAEKFLTLFWADFAQDYLPRTGARGGAKSRTGYHVFDPQDDVRPWTYLNTWHEHKAWTEAWTKGLQYPVLVGATSTYRVPALVTDMAKEPNKGVFAYTSRRPGLLQSVTNEYRREADGTVVANGAVYKIGLESSSSLQRRYTFNTPDYVFGIHKSVPKPGPAAGYQNSGNRWMGITFATTANAVVAMFGTGGGSYDRGWAEITGEARHNAMVIAKDPSAGAASLGTRIFISQAVLDNTVTSEGGWHFVRSGNGYAAFRIANQGYKLPTTTTPQGGIIYELEDPWSPVAFQMRQASDYDFVCVSNPPPTDCTAARYAAFRAAVIGNSANFTYSTAAGKLTYKSLDNQVYVIYSGANYTGNLTAYPLPTVDGGGSVSPAKTYSSPFITGVYGENTVKLNYGDHPELVLDFAYP